MSTRGLGTTSDTHRPSIVFIIGHYKTYPTRYPRQEKGGGPLGRRRRRATDAGGSRTCGSRPERGRTGALRSRSDDPPLWSPGPHHTISGPPHNRGHSRFGYVGQSGPHPPAPSRGRQVHPDGGTRRGRRRRPGRRRGRPQHGSRRGRPARGSRHPKAVDTSASRAGTSAAITRTYGSKWWHLSTSGLDLLLDGSPHPSAGGVLAERDPRNRGLQPNRHPRDKARAPSRSTRRGTPRPFPTRDPSPAVPRSHPRSVVDREAVDRGPSGLKPETFIQPVRRPTIRS